MSINKSYFIVIRILFVLFSLQFIKDAFFKWDGFSFYMSFRDFLPDLSLAFVCWSVIVWILSSLLWAAFLVLYSLLSRFIKPLRLHHFLLFVLLVYIPVYVKKTFLASFPITRLTGMSRSTIMVVGAVILIVILWIFRNRLKKIADNLLYDFDSRITPLVWLFVLLFVIAVPVSFFGSGDSAAANKTGREKNIIEMQGAQNALKRPNIIMVVMDSLAARDMQLYGYERATTPFISEWAHDAAVFNNVWSASNFTTPSTMSLLTGQRVWTHKIWYAAYNHPVGHYNKNLPQVLKDNGYATYGFVQNGNAHPAKLGLQDAFSVQKSELSFQIPKWWFSRIKDSFFPDRPIANRWIFSDSFIASQINRFVPVLNTTLKPAEMVYDKFFDLISRRKTTPFFAYIHLMPPHYDYLPPPPYMGYFGDPEKFSTDEGQWGNFNFNAEYKDEKQHDIDILRKRYDEFILYSDKAFESFIKRLEHTVDMSQTIVILTADHGESFSHGWLAHAGPPLYEFLIHVPLIIKLPAQKSGEIINMPVEQIDVAPTILELAGMKVPPWMEGRSLNPMIDGRIVAPVPVFSMYLQKNRSFGYPITKGTVAVRDGDYKFIYYLGNEKKLLFNLKSDPDEHINLYEEDNETGQGLFKLIQDNLQSVNKKSEYQK